eukprot:TRINITY_DN66893_c6_g10_i1.p1 TRINITY_DN66893_c6_g10~~TRINITY_DN66893_c6_g10_i1.p1  ORF type:complete len:784 (+),score=65.63 TRINITY_DN66893_c6_g10_i1:95-2446(+)
MVGFLSHHHSIWVNDETTEDPLADIPQGAQVRPGQAAHFLLEQICRRAQEKTNAEDQRTIARNLYEEYREASISDEAQNPDFITPMQKRLNAIKAPPPPKILTDHQDDDSNASSYESESPSAIAVGRTEKVRRQREYIKKLSKPRRATITQVDNAVKRRLDRLEKSQLPPDIGREIGDDDPQLQALATSMRGATIPRYAQTVKKTYSRAHVEHIKKVNPLRSTGVLLRSVKKMKNAVEAAERENQDQDDDDENVNSEDEDGSKTNRDSADEAEAQALRESIVSCSSDILTPRGSSQKLTQRSANNSNLNSSRKEAPVADQMKYWLSNSNHGFMGSREVVKLPPLPATSSPLQEIAKKREKERLRKKKMEEKANTKPAYKGCKSHYEHTFVEKFEKNWKEKRTKFLLQKQQKMKELREQHEDGIVMVKKREKIHKKKYEDLHPMKPIRNPWNGYNRHMETEEETYTRKIQLTTSVRQEEKERMAAIREMDIRRCRSVSPDQVHLDLTGGTEMNDTKGISPDPLLYLPMHPRGRPLTPLENPDQITAILAKDQHILHHLLRTTFKALDRDHTAQLTFSSFHVLMVHVATQLGLPVPTKNENKEAFIQLCKESGKKYVVFHQVRTEVRAMLEFHRLVLLDTEKEGGWVDGEDPNDENDDGSYQEDEFEDEEAHSYHSSSTEESNNSFVIDRRTKKKEEPVKERKPSTVSSGSLSASEKGSNATPTTSSSRTGSTKSETSPRSTHESSSLSASASGTDSWPTSDGDEGSETDYSDSLSASDSETESD